mmetsp:Transcript_27055/g.32834  ORF Transcript_27055/g.32834 Transcript_27055/m.32834 type:complete len:299 (-) Transcript_27055:258-1154(-)|eukprot:CAMPEP_0197843852 /NCGR_PEP_ID=MMETSP1438-20131217/804_1 /TAXON_ID=1461541 /ORGANISM="Pterosperma sp., Strain CCMP1384" /LENGTH=298 /DNA_ID=CAMNT_0043454269 /DNA_START=123 /DNA_END=1019 /DNA_ORIENTATION=-
MAQYGQNGQRLTQAEIDAATMRIENPSRMVGSGYIKFPPQRPFERPVVAQPPTLVDFKEYGVSDAARANAGYPPQGQNAQPPQRPPQTYQQQPYQQAPDRTGMQQQQYQANGQRPVSANAPPGYRPSQAPGNQYGGQPNHNNAGYQAQQYQQQQRQYQQQQQQQQQQQYRQQQQYQQQAAAPQHQYYQQQQQQQQQRPGYPVNQQAQQVQAQQGHFYGNRGGMVQPPSQQAPLAQAPVSRPGTAPTPPANRGPGHIVPPQPAPAPTPAAEPEPESDGGEKLSKAQRMRMRKKLREAGR